MDYSPERGADTGRLGLPIAVFLAVMLLTGAAAFARSQGLQRERQLLFDAEADRIQQEVVAAVDRQVDDFRSAVHFIRATHPSTVEQYERFFLAEEPNLIEGLPGVLLLEEISEDGLEDLIVRERSLGNDDFTISSFPGSPGPPMVITRTAQPVEFLGVGLRGLEVSMMREAMIPADFTNDDVVLHISESTQLVSFAGPEAQLEAEMEDITAVLAAGVTDTTGTFIGYAVRLDSPDTYMQFLDNDPDPNDEGDELNVELHISQIEQAFGRRLAPNAVPIEDADLRDRREVSTASLDWGIDVWANPTFGPRTGLFDQVQVWVVGSLLAIIAVLGVLLRQRTRHRLRTAKFERDHAMTLAATDGLTGLLNRNGLIDAARKRPANAAATLFFADLDGFKAVNDEHGHEHGDQVLRQVATQLRSIFRREDLISRIGGDEFVVFADGVDDGAEIDAIASRIVENISKIDGRISCSLGIAHRHQGDGTDVKELLRAGDEAMYSAKRAGGDRFEVKISDPV